MNSKQKLNASDSKQNLPNVKKMSKDELTKALVKKKRCDTRALEIVTRLLDDPIPTEEWFLNCLKYISQCHFEDVIDERFVIKKCGYPLCLNALETIPHQQYVISSKHNKVFDITERKKFCCGYCYKSASFLKEQLLTSPLWLRDQEDIPEFKLLTSYIDSKELRSESEIKMDLKIRSSQSKNLLKNNNKKKKETVFNSDERTCHVSDFNKDLDDFSNSIKQFIEVSRASPSSNTKRESSLQANLPFPSEIISDSNQCNKSKNNIPTSSNNLEIRTKTESSEKPTKPQVNVDHPETEKSINLPANETESTNICLTKELNKDKSVDALETVKKITTHKINSKSNDLNVIIAKINSRNNAQKQNIRSSKYLDPKTLPENREYGVNVTKHDADVNVLSKQMDVLSFTGRLREITVSDIEQAREQVEKCFKEWITWDSLIYLYGKNVTGKISNSLVQSDNSICTQLVSSKNLYESESYKRLCNRLTALELKNSSTSATEERRVLKPIPDFDTLRKQNHLLEIKVKSFYEGKFESEETNDASFVKNTSEVLNISEGRENAERRKILLDYFDKSLPGILNEFGIKNNEVITQLRELAGTFQLTSKNILFKPIHLKLLSCCALQILGEKNPEIKRALKSEIVYKHLANILEAYMLPKDYLISFMVETVNINKFVNN